MTTSTRSPDTADDLIQPAAAAATRSTSLPGTSDNLILLSAIGRRNLEKYKIYRQVTAQFDAIRPTATMYTAPTNYIPRPPRTSHQKKVATPRPPQPITTRGQRGQRSRRPTVTQRSRRPTVTEPPVTATPAITTALTTQTSKEKDAKTAPTFTPTTSRDTQIPVETAPPNQTSRTVQKPRPWLTQTSHTKKAARRPPRTAAALDWSMAKPVLYSTTSAPDPTNILGRQIIKLESTLHLLEAKSRFNQEQDVPSASLRPTPGPDLSSPSLWNLFLILLLFLTMRPTLAYTYDYFDCSQPSHLQTFDRLALCQQNPADKFTDPPGPVGTPV